MARQAGSRPEARGAMTLRDLEGGFAHVSAEPTRHRDQRLGILACREALEAAREGNYGVGAVLVDPAGRIVARGRNSVFFPRFRSDLHAEMVAMNAFEERHPQSEHMRGYSLVCSLEPCPMCLARLLVAGVETVKFLAPDDLAGMVGLKASFPAAWRRLWRRQEFVRADVSEGLRRFALDVFLLNLEACRRRLLSR
ncbi:MAG TPA: nucleoside deaminase [Methylomirabilota bacterium]|nr:nucleoside deaminase [Methylomirabilota bacterium]